MKRAALGHPKLVDLVHAMRAIGVPHVEAVARGVLDGLWDLTARHAMQGDIGRFSDARIARGAGWAGDAAWMIGTLLEIGWLDRHSEHRLLVHDWPEHADDAVHRAMARARLYFADGSTPKWRRLNKEERPAAQDFYEGTLLAPQLEIPEPKCDGSQRGSRLGARRAHGGGEPRPAPSSSTRESEVVIVQPARAARHVRRPAASRGVDENERSFSREEPEGGVSRGSGGGCVASEDHDRRQADMVYEIQCRLRDRSSDPRNLYRIVRAMPWGEIEGGIYAAWSRFRDGVVKNPTAYFVVCMERRAKELGVHLGQGPLPPPPSRAAAGASP